MMRSMVYLDRSLLERAKEALGLITPSAPLLMAALLAMASPASLGACTKGTFIPVQPEFYFVFTALPDTVEAGWSGAMWTGGRPVTGVDATATEGPRWAQVVRLEHAGGEAAKRLPGVTEHLILVPWDYGADCRTLPWQRSARFLEPGERGLAYAALRDPEHWVDGVPTADFHLPYSQPYPRNARLTLPPLMSIDDAFRFHHVLPRQDDLWDDAATALAPLLEWARQNPELARQWPANDMIRRNLRRINGGEVRRLEVPLGGTGRGAGAGEVVPFRHVRGTHGVIRLRDHEPDSIRKVGGMATKKSKKPEIDFERKFSSRGRWIMRNEFTAVYEQDGDWVVAYCPEVPGANGQGRTKEEARQSLVEAIGLILEECPTQAPPASWVRSQT